MVRVGSYECACGSIHVDIVQPFTSYGLVRQTSAICQCRDCVTFADAVARAAEEARKNSGQDAKDESAAKRSDVVDREMNSVHMTQFYKSDLRSIEGADLVGGLKMRPNSPFARYYSRCCGTPLFLWARHGPIVVLCAQLLGPPSAKWKDSGKPLPPLPPAVVVNHASAPPGSAPPPSDLTVRDGMLAPVFLIRVIMRVILGFVLGKNRTSVFLGESDASIGVGLDSISLRQGDKKNN